MSLFPVILWSIAGMLIVGLCIVWWRQDARERRDAALVKRWRNATVWNADSSARVVHVVRAEPGRAWLDDGETEIEVTLPEHVGDVRAGSYLHVTGWVPAQREGTKGRPVALGAAHVREAFPAHTPALDDRLMGRGARRPGLIARLLGLRGL